MNYSEVLLLVIGVSLTVGAVAVTFTLPSNRLATKAWWAGGLYMAGVNALMYFLR